jgi:hypothetical protein
MISRRRRRRRRAVVRVVEDGLTLNIDQLIRARGLIPGSRISGRIDWTFRGQPAGAVQYDSQLALPNAYLRLYFTVSDPIRGESHSMEQEIRLATTRPRFGGARWWFICPHSGARVGRLHLPPGSTQFAARQAHGLRYACQSENTCQRATRRAWKLIARLGGRPDPYFPPDKPRRMRWSTYTKAVNELRRLKPWLYG